ncbi:MAG: glycosyltransferase [Candidatus Acidiferrales bacterium]
MTETRQQWVALLGRRDTPTDGVEDYCSFLERSLKVLGIELQQTRVEWSEKGWISALTLLSSECATWRGRWVLSQYTALSWSRRGFPFGALAVLAILRQRGVRCAVVFHEPRRQSETSTRWMDYARGVCQDWVIHKLYKMAAKSVFTVPLKTVAWLPQAKNKAAFIPIGSNIPKREHHRVAPTSTTKEKTVIVFGVTATPGATEQEVRDISGVMLETCKALGRLRLVVVGRGSMEARELLEKSLRGSDIELVVRGLLSGEEIAAEFASADALLFVRGAVTPQRGTAMAGVASGIPIVGYHDENSRGPLEDAGVQWSPRQDRDALARGLIEVLSDPRLWMELHERNLQVQQAYFSWDTIAKQFCNVLDIESTSLELGRE